MDVKEIIGPGLPSCLAGIQRDLEQGLLPLKAFNDPEVHRLELRRIFMREWLFVGHEGEIPNAGDYVSRKLGEDDFLMIRSEDDRIRVLWNSCRHRGAQIVRSERGNAPGGFTCPFHGWCYDNAGALISVPSRAEGYRELKMSELGLHEAGKVEVYGGLVFANLDPNCQSFEDALGDFKWYLDIQLKLTPGGMEVLGEPHRWVVDANWKQGAENFTGDSSHTPSTHRSALAAGMVRKEFRTVPGRKFRLHVHECNGHAISIRQVDEGQAAFWDYPPEVTKYFDESPLNEAQLALARRAINHNGTLFPNFSFLHFSFTDSADRPEAGFLSLRTWQPRGPGKTEIWNWILAPKEAPEEYKRRAYRVGMSSFGPSGSFEQDDVAVWPTVAHNARGTFAEARDIKLNYQMGMGDMTTTEPLKDFPGPGHVVPSSAGEGGLRSFHETWLNRISRA